MLYLCRTFDILACQRTSRVTSAVANAASDAYGSTKGFVSKTAAQTPGLKLALATSVHRRVQIANFAIADNKTNFFFNCFFLHFYSGFWEAYASVRDFIHGQLL